MTTNTALSLTTASELAFVSEYVQPQSALLPTSAEGQLVHGLFDERNTAAAHIQAMGAVLETVRESSSHISGYFGLIHNAGIPGTESYNPGTTEHALLRMDCDKWQQFFNRSEMISMLPARMSEDFKAKMAARDLPPFTPEFVLPTLSSWMSSQYQFIAERVDGVFHALSPDHITNSPAGFGKKMIFKNAVGMKQNYSIARYIDDLRIVIASLQGTHTWLKPVNMNTSDLLRGLYNKQMFDTDLELDGGALVCRIFKVGTIHLWVHPEVAYKLNDILAMLYPQAIPAKFRKKPAVRERVFRETIQQTLPAALLQSVYDTLSKAIRLNSLDAMSYRFEITENLCDDDKYLVMVSPQAYQHHAWPALAEALGLRNLNVVLNNGCRAYTAGYDTRSVALVLLQHGSFPDKVSHQFFATKGQIAQDAAQWLLSHDAPGVSYMEPSCGHGDLLRLLPTDTRHVTAVELSPFNAAIASAVAPRAKLTVADFLDVAAQMRTAGRTVDRILMNPPYCNGQALCHTQVAAQLLPVGGVLVAVLPAILRDTTFEGFSVAQSDTYTNAFDDAGVSVFLLKLTRITA